MTKSVSENMQAALLAIIGLLAATAFVLMR